LIAGVSAFVWNCRCWCVVVAFTVVISRLLFVVVTFVRLLRVPRVCLRLLFVLIRCFTLFTGFVVAVSFCCVCVRLNYYLTLFSHGLLRLRYRLLDAFAHCYSFCCVGLCCSLVVDYVLHSGFAICCCVCSRCVLLTVLFIVTRLRCVCCLLFRLRLLLRCVVVVCIFRYWRLLFVVVVTLTLRCCLVDVVVPLHCVICCCCRCCLLLRCFLNVALHLAFVVTGIGRWLVRTLVAVVVVPFPLFGWCVAFACCFVG